MAERIYKETAYEKHEGTPHIFEAYRQNAENAAPFMILLDGSFLATAETGPEISEEIESTIEWYGWTRVSPVFA